ncbi:unnamed protein product [Cyclocybe aegerita]|uniref:Uncharacterized protein n=1 Tax=Cyclocybe aegerita TaxID=1973307 RepID=A0A8S0X9E9_CYCAE|nr:unnamed protein product [Cyclocybe aegerita]
MATVSTNLPGPSKNTALYIAIPVVVIVFLSAFMLVCRCKRNLRSPEVRLPPPKNPILLQYYERERFASNVPGPPNDNAPPPRTHLNMPIPSPAPTSQYPALPITALSHTSTQPSSSEFPVVLTVDSLQEPGPPEPVPTSLLERMREVQRLMMEIHKLEGRPGATEQEQEANLRKIRELQRRITELSEREGDRGVEGTSSPATPEIREPPPAYALTS